MQEAGLHNNPLSMRRWIEISKAASLPLLVVHQPGDTVPRRVSGDKQPVLVGTR